MMKEIKIGDINKALEEKAVKALQKELDKANARIRNVDIDDIIAALKHVEACVNVPKAHMIGVEVQIDPNAQSFPNAYRYVPKSTHFTARYARAGWYITDIKRDTCGTREYRIYLTKDAEQAVLNRIHSGR